MDGAPARALVGKLLMFLLSQLGFPPSVLVTEPAADNSIDPPLCKCERSTIETGQCGQSVFSGCVVEIPTKRRVIFSKMAFKRERDNDSLPDEFIHTSRRRAAACSVTTTRRHRQSASLAVEIGRVAGQRRRRRQQQQQQERGIGSQPASQSTTTSSSSL
ncbi:hypothetical protein TTRE_0000545601 [Trichuris trichiura]|uniref:Uncharacterized protein n=1 Tax=Trichuris trichiura TaxID=36087 RepID=A0A077ZAB1_TRITR|nr:hypothetical protein TTRE_0000545601 [Trichuris trichiura]